MAENDINRSRFNEYLVRLLGMESFPPAAQLAAEIVPVVEIEPYALESYWLSSQRLCSAAPNIDGVALQLPKTRLRNPANSGVVAIIEMVVVSSNTNVTVHGGISAITADLVTPTVTDSRDGRAGGLPACIITQATAVGSSGGSFGLFLLGLLAETSYTLMDLAVVPPGRAVEIEGSIAGLPLRVTWHWRERALAAVENPPR